VHSTDAFGSGGMKALAAALQGYGVTPVLVQRYTNNSQDFTPVVLAGGTALRVCASRRTRRAAQSSGKCPPVCANPLARRNRNWTR
jgi:hypothetical protein